MSLRNLRPSKSRWQSLRRLRRAHRQFFVDTRNRACVPFGLRKPRLRLAVERAVLADEYEKTDACQATRQCAAWLPERQGCSMPACRQTGLPHSTCAARTTLFFPAKFLKMHRNFPLPKGGDHPNVVATSARTWTPSDRLTRGHVLGRKVAFRRRFLRRKDNHA